MFKYFNNVRQEMYEFLPDNYDTILEIGCGEGIFMSSLAAKETWGIEINVEAAKIAKKKIKNVLVGDYSIHINSIPNNYFDVIVLNDVIEHVYETNEFLVFVKTKLKNNGVLIASIPNVRYALNLFDLLIKKDWQYKEYGILDYTHVRFFTKKSIIRLMNNNDFTIKKMHGINSIITRNATIKGIAKSILGIIILLVTIGYYKDALYLQYGLSANKKID